MATTIFDGLTPEPSRPDDEELMHWSDSPEAQAMLQEILYPLRSPEVQASIEHILRRFALVDEVLDCFDDRHPALDVVRVDELMRCAVAERMSLGWFAVELIEAAVKLDRSARAKAGALARDARAAGVRERLRAEWVAAKAADPQREKTAFAHERFAAVRKAGADVTLRTIREDWLKGL